MDELKAEPKAVSLILADDERVPVRWWELEEGGWVKIPFIDEDEMKALRHRCGISATKDRIKESQLQKLHEIVLLEKQLEWRGIGLSADPKSLVQFPSDDEKRRIGTKLKDFSARLLAACRDWSEFQEEMEQDRKKS